MATRRTKEGLPVVTEATFMEFLKKYPIRSRNNDPKVTRRIAQENPQIHRILEIGMREAPSESARVYYECGMQIVYELLRTQSNKIYRNQ